MTCVEIERFFSSMLRKMGKCMKENGQCQGFWLTEMDWVLGSYGWVLYRKLSTQWAHEGTPGVELENLIIALAWIHCDIGHTTLSLVNSTFYLDMDTE